VPVTLYTLTAPQNPDLAKWATVIRLPFSGRLGLVANGIYLAVVLRRDRSSILHVHYASSYGLMALISCTGRWLLSVWGSDVFEFPDRSPVHRLLIRAILERATRITATSASLQERVQELTSGGIDASVIPFGVHRSWIEGERPDRNGPFRCISVKSLEATYNIDVAIESFGIALRNGLPPDSEFWIIGDGPENRKLQQMAKSLGISSNIIFKGRIPHDGVREMIDQADVLLNLSLHESFGVAVIEASARGIPVIATDVGGLKEVIDPGKTGFLVPVGERETTARILLELHRDPASRRHIGESGRNWVRSRYVFEENLERLLALYRTF